MSVQNTVEDSGKNTPKMLCGILTACL